MEYAHPLILNSDDTYNLENVGNEVTLLKKIALRLLSENKVTFMKGTFLNFLLSKIVESIWFDAYGMGFVMKSSALRLFCQFL